MKQKISNFFRRAALSIKNFFACLPRRTVILGSYVLVLLLLFGAFYWRAVSTMPDFEIPAGEEKAQEEDEKGKAEEKGSTESTFYYELPTEEYGQPPEEGGLRDKENEVRESTTATETEAEAEKETEAETEGETEGENEAETVSSKLTTPPALPLSQWQVVRPFGTHVIEELPSGRRLHLLTKGVDLSTVDAAPVSVLWDGTVKSINEKDPLYGKTVLVEHQGEDFSFYGNLGEIWVKEGQQITRGEHMGKLYPASSRGGDSFLYMEVLEKGKRVDPLDLLEGVARH